MKIFDLKTIPSFVPIDQIKEMCHFLGKENCRIVGGLARDILLNRETLDIDIATTLLPPDASSQLKSYNIRVIPTGITHGTITAIYKGLEYQITTLRYDKECMGRAAKVEFTDNWARDAMRRDFTINALYIDMIDGKIYDYCNSISDIKKPLIRFIGQCTKRILEDHLRIVRFFRFGARFGLKALEIESLDACIMHKHLLEKLSGERLFSEITKILSAKYAKEILIKMSKVGILDYFNIYGLDIKALQKCNITSDCDITNFAILMHCSKSDLSIVASRLKLPKKYINFIKNTQAITVQAKPTKQEATKDLFLVGAEIYKSMFQFLSCVYPEKYKTNDLIKILKYKVPELPINAQDIISLGFQGKEISCKLDKAKELWIKNDFKIKRSAILELLKF